MSGKLAEERRAESEEFRTGVGGGGDGGLGFKESRRVNGGGKADWTA